MPGVEVEEEEIGVGTLELHHGNLAADPACSQIFIGNLKTMRVEGEKVISQGKPLCKGRANLTLVVAETGEATLEETSSLESLTMAICT